jgi:DNA repair protein RadC
MIESTKQSPSLLLTDLPPTAIGKRGYRSRMHLRALAPGTDGLADHELLEMLLSPAFKSGNTKLVALALITKFGTYGKVLSASESDLLATPGLDRRAVSAIKIVHASLLRLARADVMNTPVLRNWRALKTYLHVLMAREPVEQFRVLYLDARNRLIADEVEGHGTVNHTPVYPREVMRRALELRAVSLVIVHNHPSGDISPSVDDIEMTREISAAASALSIVLLDHIIVGNGRCWSFRQARLLPIINRSVSTNRKRLASP